MGELHQQMQDIFRHSGSVAGIDTDTGDAVFPDGRQSLRDRMLKAPDSSDQHSSDHQSPPTRHWFGGFMVPNWDRIKPRSKGDIDLDGEITEKGLSVVLDEPRLLTPDLPREPQYSSQHSSVSITTIRRGDGTVEERRTVRYSDGRVETTRTVNGEKVEDLPSTDQRDLSLFGKLWQDENNAESSREGIIVLPPQPGHIHRSLLWRLFGLDFSQPRS
ncbi:HCLS1-associated protein X-1-like isoform X2 [Gigantopelta aegis]|nr:HCLS1-associated protein X-1-like isoform X2 [Gigantopelta aegis]